jgi:hypothetical protein
VWPHIQSHAFYDYDPLSSTSATLTNGDLRGYDALITLSLMYIESAKATDYELIV